MTRKEWYAKHPRIKEAGYNATSDGFWEREITNEAGWLLDFWGGETPLAYCEVGVSQAKSACILLHRLPLLQYTGVDNWLGWDEDREITYHNLGHFPQARWQIVDCDSTEAAQRFPAASFDVVFIDASKADEKYLADCLAWWPKVKPGGWVAGHDICHPLWINRDKVDRVAEQVQTFCGRVGVVLTAANVLPVRNVWKVQKPC